MRRGGGVALDESTETRAPRMQTRSSCVRVRGMLLEAPSALLSSAVPASQIGVRVNGRSCGCRL